MTLEELQKFENPKKAENPYFRNILPRWRDAMLHVWNGDLRTTPSYRLAECVQLLESYSRIMIADEVFKAEIAAKCKKIVAILQVNGHFIDVEVD